jgi:hypothetical protein
VKQSTETIATLDTYLVLLDRWCNRRTCRMGWVEAQGSVRSVTVVMCDEDGQDVEPLEPHRLHGEEVYGEQASPMRSEKLAPAHPATRAGWSETCAPKPSAHRRG